MPIRRARSLFTFALFGIACGGIKPVGSVDRERPNIVSVDGRAPRSASLAASIELEFGAFSRSSTSTAIATLVWFA